MNNETCAHEWKRDVTACADRCVKCGYLSLLRSDRMRLLLQNIQKASYGE